MGYVYCLLLPGCIECIDFQSCGLLAECVPSLSFLLTFRKAPYYTCEGTLKVTFFG